MAGRNFPRGTRLPMEALSAADRIKRKFGGGVDLTPDQLAALACYDSLPSAAQRMLARDAGDTGFIQGGAILDAKRDFTQAEGEGLLTSTLEEGDQDGPEHIARIDYDTTDDVEPV